jgi:F-type H+-transporting ATPase subunit b
MFDLGVTFLITAVNFLILYLFLKRFLFGRVRDFLDARAGKIKREMDETALARVRVEEMQCRYEELLAIAEKEGEYLLKESEDRAKGEYDRILDEAESAADSIKRQADEAAGRERSRARDQLAADVAMLAVEGATRIARRQMGSQDDLRLVEAFVRGVGEKRGL